MATTLATALATTLTLAAEATEHEATGPNPYLIGGLALLILLVMLFIVVTVGGGREHS